jgi:hypothetical protein
MLNLASPSRDCEVPLHRARIRHGLTFSSDSVTNAPGVGRRVWL